MIRSNRVPSTSRDRVALRLRAALTHLLVAASLFMGPGTTAALAQATGPAVQTAVDRVAEIERTLNGLEAAQPDAYWTKDDLAYDPSLLLASLLCDAGFTARIARATLLDAAAVELVSTIRSPALVG